MANGHLICGCVHSDAIHRLDRETVQSKQFLNRVTERTSLVDFILDVHFRALQTYTLISLSHTAPPLPLGNLRRGATPSSVGLQLEKQYTFITAEATHACLLNVSLWEEKSKCVYILYILLNI